MIELVEFSKSGISDEQWDKFVEESDNGTLFHTRRFLSYHNKNKFHDASLVFLKNSNIYSLFTAAIRKTDSGNILSSHSGASFGGFVVKKELSIKDAFDMVKLLIGFAHGKKCDKIDLTVPPMIYQSKYSNYIDFALVQNGFEYRKREISSVVQLDVDDENLLYTFRPTARTAVHRAIKQNVEIVETEKFAEYYEILKKNLKMRHNVNPTHTLDELLKLKKLFPSKIRLWGAFVDGKLAAGVCNFSANSKVVLAFYISHSEEYQKYRPVNLLFYEIMKHYRYEGYKFLDFGIFTVNEEPNWGLGRFKENFGARGIFRDTLVKNL